MQPFDKHLANAGDLERCGSQLTRHASELLTVQGATMRAFQPATANWSGVGAQELMVAPRPVEQSAKAVTSALAWAAVVTNYWAAQVTAFNHRVEEITSGLNGQGPHYGAQGRDGDPPTEDDVDAARGAAVAEAKRQWWQAHELYIVTGGEKAASMLEQGPTSGNLAEAQRVGALPSAGGGAGGDDSAWEHLVDFFLGDVGNLWNGGREGFPYGAMGAGLLRVFRTAVWLRAPSNANFPTFNTGFVGRGVASLAQRIPGLGALGTWLPSTAATTFFTRVGIVGGVVGTAMGTYDLIKQGNPVDAFKRDGAGYVADVAKTGFSASSTAFFLAPNPVTGALVIGTGVVWAGAEIVDNWDDISDAAGDAWDATTDVAGDAWDGAKDVASKLNPFD